MQLKAKLLHKLSAIDDEATLKEIYDWLEAYLVADSNTTFESVEIQAVTEGYQQYLSGNTISHKQAAIRFDQWT